MGTTDQALNADPAPRRGLWRLARLVALGFASGAVAGLASFVFLEGLERATSFRLDHPLVIWLLPGAGGVIGWLAHRAGPRASAGTGLAVREGRTFTTGVPAAMAPLALGGTLLGHVVGASVGREGAGVQMSAALTDAAARRVRVDVETRTVLARAALAAGFGSVFGVPFAGAVFAVESTRHRDRSTLAAVVPAAFVGNAVVVALGHHHVHRTPVSAPIGVGLVAAMLAAGLAFGLAAATFSHALRWFRSALGGIVGRPWRPVVGGAATLVVVAVVGRDHLGLSLPLLDSALTGGDVAWYDPVVKVVLTVIALGSGFVGGEVTPLFVVGATLGARLADVVHQPAPLVAAVGMCVVFGAAAPVPLTCVAMAIELFGAGIAIPALIACGAAWAVAAQLRTSLYGSASAALEDPHR